MHKVQVDPECNLLLVDEPGVLGAGGNSGFQALNIAVQFGAMRIILVGFDMHRAAGVHWHGAHANNLNNPSDVNFIRWRKAFEGIGPALYRLGVEVVNASPDSALMAFPKMTIERAFTRWGL